MTYASEARKTEEQKEAEAARKEELARLQEKTTGAIRRTFATADGRIALRAIMERCHYQLSITATAPNVGVDTNATLHNAALHKHYLWLRQYIDHKSLIAVEITGITKDLLE